jgi:hypothetical protein
MGFNPELMALKQIVQLGIKFLDPSAVKKDNYEIKWRPALDSRPFEGIFVSEFSKLPFLTRKFIVDNLNPEIKADMAKIKSHLRSYYIKVFNPGGVLTQEKKLNLLNENLYTREKIEKRKRDYEILREERIASSLRREKEQLEKSLHTPKKRRKKFSETFVTPPLLRKAAACKAPKAFSSKLKDNSQSISVTPRREIHTQGGLSHSTDNSRDQPMENMRFQHPYGLPDILIIDYPTRIDIGSGSEGQVTPLLQKSNNIFNPFDLDDVPHFTFADVRATKVFVFSKSICSNQYMSIEHTTPRSLPGHELEEVSDSAMPPPSIFTYKHTGRLCVRNQKRKYVITTSQSYRPRIVNSGDRTKAFYLKQYVHLNRLRPPEHKANNGALYLLAT